MKQEQQTKVTIKQESPIPKPSEPFPEEFLLMLQSRFTTKRHPKQPDTQSGYQSNKH